MEAESNIFEQIKRILHSFQGHYSILEHQVEVDVQLEYFNRSRTFRAHAIPIETLKQKDLLYSAQATVEEKKELLVKLASIDEPEAYRIIEHYLKVADEELIGWARLALQESRLLLECKFLGENQVLISTGLGGRTGKLRYFVVVFAENGQFTETQMNHLKGEFEFTLKKCQAELEQVLFYGSYATMLALVPLEVTVIDLVKSAVDECNSLGRFVKKDFIITNVRTLRGEEIAAILSSKLPEDLNAE